MALNKCLLIGRITKDPELAYTQSGVAVCRISIAMNRPYTSTNGERETDFIDVVTWRKSAEFVCKYFRKGDPIQVEGSIQSRRWQDNDGKNRISIEINATEVSFVEGYKRNNDSIGDVNIDDSLDTTDFMPTPPDNFDDLPF